MADRLEMQGEDRPMMRVPRTVFVKVSTDLIGDCIDWSDPVQVRIEHQPDDTYELVFRRVE